MSIFSCCCPWLFRKSIVKSSEGYGALEDAPPSIVVSPAQTPLHVSPVLVPTSATEAVSRAAAAATTEQPVFSEKLPREMGAEAVGIDWYHLSSQDLGDPNQILPFDQEDRREYAEVLRLGERVTVSTVHFEAPVLSPASFIRPLVMPEEKE